MRGLILAALLVLVPLGARAQKIVGPIDHREVPNTALIGGSSNGALAGVTLGANLSLATGVLSAAGTAPGGSTGQLQFNNAGVLGGITVSGDATLNTATGALTVTGTNGVAFGSLATLNAAPAGTLTGSTLASGITGSSLTSLAGGTVGTAAYLNTGTSGGTLPLLNGVNTWSGAQTFSGGLSGALTGGASLDLPLAGGTVTGATAFSAAGTALSVTNNATIGGTLGVTGIFSVGSTFNIGTGVAANANTTIKTPNGSNIIINPQGTAYTQIDSALNVVGTITPEASGVWSGSSYAGNSAIQENTTWTGTSTAGGNPTAFNAFTGVDSVDSSGAAFATMLWVRDNISSSAKKGGANAFVVSLNFTAATGNANGAEYAGLTSTVNVTSGDNGTSGHFQSSFTAANPVLQLSSAALYTAGGSGEEIDVGFAAAATTKIGLLVDQLGLDTTNATVDDIGIAIDAQSTGTSGFLNGLSFGRSGGSFPIKSTGTLIYGEGNGGASWTVANGIDWHLGTFTGNSWNDGHIQMTGAGDLLANSASPLATSAVAGFLHLPHTTAAPTGTPTNTTPGCEWNTATHTLNCYDGSSWYHFTGTGGAG